jgi:hypothetical protein
MAMKLAGTVDAGRFLIASCSLPSTHDPPSTETIGAPEDLRYSDKNVRFMHYVGGLLC